MSSSLAEDSKFIRFSVNSFQSKTSWINERNIFGLKAKDRNLSRFKFSAAKPKRRITRASLRRRNEARAPITTFPTPTSWSSSKGKKTFKKSGTFRPLPRAESSSSSPPQNSGFSFWFSSYCLLSICIRLLHQKNDPRVPSSRTLRKHRIFVVVYKKCNSSYILLTT